MVDILQLREIDGIESNIGEYEIIFDKPITIYPEDSISMKSCFIDTKEQDDRITLDEDSNADIFFSYYLNNFNTDTAPYFKNDPPTGKSYILLEVDDAGSLVPNVRQLRSIEFGRQKIMAISEKHISVLYTDKDGNQKSIPIVLPAVSPTSGPEWYTPPTPIVIYQGDITFQHNGKIYTVNDSRWDTDIGWSESRSSRVPNVLSDKVYENVVFNEYAPYRPIKIPKGKYTPIELTETINKQLTQLSDENYNVEKLEDMASNTALIRDIDFFRNITATGPPNNPKLKNYVWYSQDEQLIFPIEKPDPTSNPPKTVPPAIFVGTDSFSFGYNEDTKLFQINQMHMPIYDANGNQVIQTIQPNGKNSLAKIVSAGGAFISGYAKYSGSNILFDIMGFSYDNLYNSGIQVIPLLDNYINSSFPTYANPLQKGVNTTGAYLGINSITNKNVNSILVSNALTFTEVSTQTNPIIAEKPYTGNIDAEQGYYLIEISGFNNTNDYIGQKYSNNKIKAIVSRYYSINSYTSSGGESDIQYVNVSNNTQFIKSLKVRILNPDGTLASNISNDNTVFLQINRRNLLNPYVPVDSQPESNENDKKDKDNKNEK